MKTSKKLIALVLFVAMMLMMVPAANAATAEGDLRWHRTNTYYEIGFENVDNFWFIGPGNVTLDSVKGYASLDKFEVPSVNGTSATDYAALKTSNITNDAEFTGVNKLTDALAKIGNDDYGLAGGSSNVTITADGKYSNLTPYYYTQYGAGGPRGTVLKVPYKVYKVDEYQLQVYNGSKWVAADDDGDETTIRKDYVYKYAYTEITALLSIDGVLSGASYMPTANAGIVYYLDFVLEDGGNTTKKSISYNGSNILDVTVKFNSAASASSTNFGLNVVGKSGSQKANFNVVSQTTGKDYNNILYFDIAKRTKDDNKEIGTLDVPVISDYFIPVENGHATDYVTITTTADGFKKATITTNAVAVPSVTGLYKAKDATKSLEKWVEAFNDDNKDLIGSDNVMSVKLQAVNADGAVMAYATTLTATVKTGSSRSSNAIITGNALLLKGTEQYTLIGGDTQYFLDADGCFTLNLYGIKSWQAISSTTITYYSEKMMEIEFVFKNGTTKVGEGVYDIVFRNIERNASGITVLQSEYNLEIGETATIQFVLNDENALDKSVEWKSVNKGIVKVTTASTGKIEAVALGTALVYTEDASGNAHVVTVNVVDPAAEPDPTDEPGGEPSDEDGAEYVVTASSLNVRKGPGTSYGKVGSLKRGASVTVIGESGSWMEIEAQSSFKAADKYYVSGKYLALAD